MPDLLTHACTGLLLKAATGGRHVGATVLGTALPDLTSRVPIMGIDLLIRLGVPIPIEVMYPWAVLHMPIANVAACGLVALPFREDQRADVFLWLLVGSALHFLADVFQAHHGEGYFLLFPLTTNTYELGLIGSETTVLYAPALIVLTVVAWAARLGWARARGRQGRMRP